MYVCGRLVFTSDKIKALEVTAKLKQQNFYNVQICPRTMTITTTTARKTMPTTTTMLMIKIISQMTLLQAKQETKTKKDCYF